MPHYLQFRVELARIVPPIWRRFQIRSTDTFADLHDAIQAAGPWTSAHAYHFLQSRRGHVMAQSSRDDPLEGAMLAELTPLDAYFGNRANKLCVYVYDLSAKWVHEVRLERTIQGRKRFVRRLMAGSRAFPKDDIGGLSEYRAHVAILKQGQANTAGARNRLAWLRGWDPDFFDLEIAKETFDRS